MKIDWLINVKMRYTDLRFTYLLTYLVTWGRDG